MIALAPARAREGLEWSFLREWIGPRPNVEITAEDFSVPEVRAIFAAALDDRDAPDLHLYQDAAAALGVTLDELVVKASEFSIATPLLSPMPLVDIQRMARRLRAEAERERAERGLCDAMDGFGAHGDPQRVADAAQRLVKAQAGGDVAAVVPSLADGWRDPAEAPQVRLRTGVGFFDEAMGGGLLPGSVTAFCAAPKLGKSAFTLQVALRFAATNPGDAALLWSGEMSRGVVQRRALSHLAQLPPLILERPDAELTAAQREDKARGVARFLSLAPRVRIVTGGQTAGGIARVAEAVGARLVVVDYLQLLTSDAGETRREQVEATSRALCSWAAHSGVAVLAVASTTKEFSRAGAVPDIAGVFREAGAVGFDVDCAYFGSEDAEVTRAMGDPSRVAIHWRCLGNRHDEPRDMAVVLHRSTQSFRALDQRRTNG
ncbi:MAG: DnaB-like helicase C-terminal domain-containing protein [Phycisphaerales bacterium]